MRCPKCQSDNPDDSKFCKECGTNISSVGEAQPSITKTLETPREELTTGSTFAGRFQIIEELGRGGMGKVYKANDTDIKEKVAIKLIKPEISTDRNTIERFQNELKFARKIRHKNVCQMYDLNKDEGSYYITMEYVEGENLKNMIRMSGQLSTGTAISVAQQVCEGLAEAHKLGVIHRDLKPSNIMIDREGSVRIMDFGIARHLKEKGITGAGIMIGTPEYMSPEQVDGQAPDQRADIYSLGIILYEMVTGQVPFEGDTPFSIGVKQKSEIPRPPKEINEQILESLNRMILKCLEKEKENRYQSAGELLHALTALEKGIPTTERTIPAKKTATSKEVTVTVQRRWVWAAVSLMIVAASVLAFLLLKGERSAAPAENDMLIVLPFDNEGLQADDYLANGITREITDRLSLLQELDVIAYTSATQAKNAGKTIRQIREEFAVDYVVTGTVLQDKSGGERGLLLVSAELIKASDETQIWSDKIRRNLEDIAEVQAQIAEEVVKKLDLTLLEPVREAMWAKPTENMEAYDYYLRAREHLDTAWGGTLEYHAEYEMAFEMFEKATDSDPDFILAWLWNSLIHSWLYHYGVDRSDERLEKSKWALDKAREIEPDLPETNIFLAYYYFWGFLDTERAEELYESVRKVRPNITTGLIAEIYAAQGKFEEAVEAYEEEITRDPLNHINPANLAGILTQMRRYTEAVAWFDRSLSLDPGNFVTLINKFINSLMWKGYTEETLALFDMIPAGDLKDLVWIISAASYSRNFEGALDRLNRLQLDTFEIGSLYFNKDLYYAILYHRLGKSSLKESHAESARRTLEDLIEKSPEDPRYHSHIGIANALLGRKEDALREGRRAVDLYPIKKDAMLGTAYIMNLSHILIIVEEYEEAISHLEHMMSIPAGRNVSTASLQSQAIYNPLRDLPRFKALLEKHPKDDS